MANLTVSKMEEFDGEEVWVVFLGDGDAIVGMCNTQEEALLLRDRLAAANDLSIGEN